MKETHFNVKLVAGFYIISIYLFINLLLAHIQGIATHYIYPGSSSYGFTSDWIYIFVIILLTITFSKIVLDKWNTKINMLNFLHYFGIYKIVSEFVFLPTLASMIIRYLEYPLDGLFSHIMLSSSDLAFDLIVGIVSIFFGYRYHRKNEISAQQ